MIEYYEDSGRWNGVGWTHKHCGGGAPCQLNMFAAGPWGWMQDFRVHPNSLTQEEFQTVHVGEWDQGDAFRADTLFWSKWAQGGLTTDGTPTRRPLSLALEERQTTCPAGSRSDCVGYQRFHLGYVWMGAFLGRESIHCPDVSDGAPYNPMDRNENVDLVDALVSCNGSVLASRGSTSTATSRSTFKMRSLLWRSSGRTASRLEVRRFAQHAHSRRADAGLSVGLRQRR
jgi:hypothetical protein